jgi:putative ABC transport system ATP-binding protein
LDSKTSDEIMQMLIRLNDAGKTIVMVTHENDIAAWAKRIIRMRDGVIETDEQNQQAQPPQQGVTAAFVSNLNSLLSEAIR